MGWLVAQTVRADAKELNAGSNHLTNPDGFQVGRLKRSNGQTLCGTKPFDLQAVRGMPTCPRCIEMGHRLGILPSTFQGQQPIPHDFQLPFPEAELERCFNCGAGKGSPAGIEPCKPVKSFMQYRQERAR